MSIAENIARIHEEIEAACRRCGRDAREVRLEAVSKFHPLSAVREAFDAGERLFGESRVQEAAAKYEAGKPEGAEIHFIGTLQRNKAKTAASLFETIESVDRDDLITELGKWTRERKTPLPILLELNAGEASKSGYPDTDALLRAAERTLCEPGLSLRGLMTMAPYVNDALRIRAAFANLRKARDILASHFPECRADCLSMGMSGDFPIAIEEGSTLVRIGTAIFGARSVPERVHPL